jgi:hypothetical protein
VATGLQLVIISIIIILIIIIMDRIGEVEMSIRE